MKYYDGAPYYDDYDPNKDYVQVLAKSGNYAQAREFTQVGTIYRDFMERLGNAIFSNGHIISGCELVVSSDKTQCVLQTGTMYLDGLVRKIRTPITVGIAGVGEEIIGVKIKEELITAIEDVSLRNPAVGTEGYNQEGASRVRQTVILTVNDPDAVSIAKLIDGVIVQEVVPKTDEDDNDALMDLLAKRTYDTSGSFKVSGLYLSDKETAEDDVSKIYVGEGTAYIAGYNVIFKNMKEQELEIPMTYRTLNNEPHLFTSISDKMYLNNGPVRQINQLTTVCQATRKIQRGTSGGRDLCVDESSENLLIILQVSYNGIIYTAGQDYAQSGNYIDWSPIAGSEPPTGVQYDVLFQYTKTNRIDVDYILGDAETEPYVQILSTASSIPVENSSVLVDYDFYLSRMDTICLDRYGAISVLQGIPEKTIYANPPINFDDRKLTLGTVLCYAHSKNKKIINTSTKRLTQTELYNLKRRIDDTEYNQAIKDLDDEAKKGEDASMLKGIFTDGFIGYTKCDFGDEEWNCSIDLDMQEMTLPFEQKVTGLTIDNSSTETNVAVTGRVITAPYREVVALAQPKATAKFLINPYSIFTGEAICALDPSVDNWIETKRVSVNNVVADSDLLRQWWQRRGSDWVAENTSGTFSEGNIDYNIESVSTSVSQSVKEKAITYMRSKQVSVTGIGFFPDEDNIELFFNQERITIQDPSIRGTNENTVKANDLGKLTCKFTVPEKTPCGVVQVKLKGPLISGATSYESIGTLRTTTSTTTTTIRGSANLNPVPQNLDPLAQTFRFEEDNIIMACDLFFTYKDSTRPVYVQIRNVENGYPGAVCYASTALAPSEVTVNTDEPVATHVVFDQPVYCNADTDYALVVISESNVYQIWVANMGENDVKTGVPVTIQPYLDGLMFSSSNNLAWTTHQTSDLTFTLYKAEYTGEGVVVFNRVPVTEQFDRLVLAGSYDDRRNLGVEWWYRINEDTEWSPIETFDAKEMDKIGTSVDLKAVIKVSRSTSPIIARDSLNIVAFLNGLTATYVSRTVFMEDDFTNIKVSCDFALPDGCSAEVYYKLPDVSSSWVKLEDPTLTNMSDEFVRYTFTKDQVRAKSFKVKVVLKTLNPLHRPRAKKLMCIMKY